LACFNKNFKMKPQFFINAVYMRSDLKGEGGLELLDLLIFTH
jgi:hypothetical protein